MKNRLGARWEEYLGARWEEYLGARWEEYLGARSWVLDQHYVYRMSERSMKHW